jgi:hypothetical protein
MDQCVDGSHFEYCNNRPLWGIYIALSCVLLGASVDVYDFGI